MSEAKLRKSMEKEIEMKVRAEVKVDFERRMR